MEHHIAMAIPLAGRGLEVAGVYALFTTLTSLTMVLRIYCRVCLVKKFGWDDWTAAVAWVGFRQSFSESATDISQAIFIAHAACAFSGVQHGTGQHAWDIQPPTEIPIGLMVRGLCLVMPDANVWQWWWMVSSACTCPAYHGARPAWEESVVPLSGSWSPQAIAASAHACSSCQRVSTTRIDCSWTVAFERKIAHV